MFDYFKKTLEQHDRNFVILKGDKKTRLRKAVSEIDKLLE